MAVIETFGPRRNILFRDHLVGLLVGLLLTACAPGHVMENGNAKPDSTSEHGDTYDTYTDAYDIYKKALAATEKKEHDKAVELYSRVLYSNDPRLFASAHINRAQAYKGLKNYTESLYDHKIYLQIKKANGERPSSKQFYLSRADVLIDLGRLDEARADMEFARTFVGELDEKMDAMQDLVGDMTTIMYAILYEKLGDRSEGMRLINAALKDKRELHGPARDLYLFMGLFTRSLFHQNAADYESALADIDMAEKRLVTIIAGKPANDPSQGSFRKIFDTVISLNRARVLDLSGQNRAAITPLRDVQRNVSELSAIAPDKEKVARAETLIDRALIELDTIDADQNSSALNELVEEFGDSFRLHVSFGETVKLGD